MTMDKTTYLITKTNFKDELKKIYIRDENENLSKLTRYNMILIFFNYIYHYLDFRKLSMEKSCELVLTQTEGFLNWKMLKESHR